MKAVMLAAGVGRRLYGDGNDDPPKALLEFDGRTLLARHIEVLTALGVEELTVVVGHKKEMIEEELARVAPAGFARTLFNTRYEESPILSLARAGEVLRSGSRVLFMDADVYYHEDLLKALVNSRHQTCIILDRDFEPGDEPVKTCVRDNLIVDFGKKVFEPHDMVGEWPGFLTMAPDVALRVADRADELSWGDMPGFVYEDAFCDVMKASEPGTFGFEDVTGIPWIEIDFPEDRERADSEIRARIAAYRPLGARVGAAAE
ncbi:MAG: ADP-glucose pyrophosphorylase [Rhodospirillales bacterium CG15_BIG_FIL_POST_REV_8_21_14_020_66_15]|nr:MAG: ADP-glucose pyrophosphorylase [Rhodospirillales bacterium CG15_BIG_FIL_POST_REV_8_21_14_020_66_15]